MFVTVCDIMLVPNPRYKIEMRKKNKIESTIFGSDNIQARKIYLWYSQSI